MLKEPSQSATLILWFLTHLSCCLRIKTPSVAQFLSDTLPLLECGGPPIWIIAMLAIYCTIENGWCQNVHHLKRKIQQTGMRMHMHVNCILPKTLMVKSKSIELVYRSVALCSLHVTCNSCLFIPGSGIPLSVGSFCCCFPPMSAPHPPFSHLIRIVQTVNSIKSIVIVILCCT